MNQPQQVSNALESLLVSEFRTSQALHNLTKDERTALSQGDVARLLTLVKHKEALLDQLVQLTDARRAILLDASSSLNLAADSTASPQMLADVLTAIDEDAAYRLCHLQDGVLVLMSQVRDMTQGNRALAASALRRADSLQASLINQIPSQQGEAPLTLASLSWLTRTPHPNQDQLQSPSHNAANAEIDSLEEQALLPAVFAALISARDALNASDHVMATTALGDLQKALDYIDQVLESNDPQTKQANEEALRLEQAPSRQFKPAAAKEDANLVETIASLYHQGTAYQAVLNTSNRTLAFA